MGSGCQGNGEANEEGGAKAQGMKVTKKNPVRYLVGPLVHGFEKAACMQSVLYYNWPLNLLHSPTRDSSHILALKTYMS